MQYNIFMLFMYASEIDQGNDGGSSGKKSANALDKKAFIDVSLVLSMSLLLMLTSDLSSSVRFYVILACSAICIGFLLGKMFLKYKQEHIHRMIFIAMFVVVLLNYLLFFIYYKLDINNYQDQIIIYYMLKIFEFIWEIELYDLYNKSITCIFIAYFGIGTFAFIEISRILFRLSDTYGIYFILMLLVVYFAVMYALW